jgi:glutamyl-tRNA reductase
VDIAVPRDVDHAVGLLDDVTLLDMDDLTTFAEAGRQERAQEVSAVEAIIEGEMARFADVRSARELAPLITALHGHGEAVRLAELDRHRAGLAGLDPAQRKLVDAVTRGLVNKLLHSPTVQVKETAGTLNGDRLADSLRELFEL